MFFCPTAGVFIVAAKRTPFGTYGGVLKDHSATDLAEHAAKAALAAGAVAPEIVNSVIMGNVLQTSADAPYIARHVGLRCGVPIPVPALTVNRLCGSGFQSIINGAQEICLRESDVVLCGGSESMSQAPYAVRNIRFGTKFGFDLKVSLFSCEHYRPPYMQTCLFVRLQTSHSTTVLPLWVFGSFPEVHYLFHTGPIWSVLLLFHRVPSTVKHPRLTQFFLPSQSLPGLQGVSDGAAALVITSEEALKEHKLTPLARVVAYHVSGCDPSIMGIGPVPAVTEALKKAGLSLSDMDLVEVNEAFAPQYLAVAKALGLDPEKSNVNGGAIAIGHPLGASGARITAHLVHELRRRGGKYAVGSACIGGGQGIAIVLEKC
uniref:Acetyl-CoA acyltransferase 2 n=1 Tax=Fundulus heteroclitus TaxID=8078 RepID=A0A3Q2QHC1_FUNHE